MKRPCPFEACARLQLKTHVGDKEINTGVMRDTNLKHVHAKTLRMLFEGSRNLTNNNTPSQPRLAASVADISSYSNHRQMSLTTQGGMCLTPAAQPIQCASPERCCCCDRLLPASLASAAGTGECRSPEDGAVWAASCHYCERRPLCAACIRLCLVCAHHFCPQHSFNSYAHEYDAAVCLSCYR